MTLMPPFASILLLASIAPVTAWRSFLQRLAVFAMASALGAFGRDQQAAALGSFSAIAARGGGIVRTAASDCPQTVTAAAAGVPT